MAYETTKKIMTKDAEKKKKKKKAAMSLAEKINFGGKFRKTK